MSSRRTGPLLLLLLLTLAAAWPSAPARAGQTADNDPAAALAAARDCGLPAATQDRLLAAGLEGRLAQADILAVLETFTRACGQGLPTRPLADKLDEGLAKRVPGPRLVAALAGLTGDLAWCRDLLVRLRRAPDAAPAPGDVTRLAQSLAAGLDRPTLEDFLTQAPAAPPAMLARAGAVLALMRQAGFDPERCHALLDAGLARGSLGPGWERLSAVALLARQRGLADDAVLDAARNALEQGHTLRRLMEDLGFTPRDVERGGARP
ncbi:MAG: hypothetical protein AB7D57_12865 [Desulfovibrionaceae bacterium]